MQIRIIERKKLFLIPRNGSQKKELLMKLIRKIFAKAEAGHRSWGGLGI
jgi:hypothetical protein